MQRYQNKKDMKRIIIIAVIVLLVIIGIVFIVKKNKKAPVAVTPTPQPTVLYQSTFATSSMVSWKEGEATLSIQKASLEGSKLTLFLRVKNGKTAKCIPLNLRQIADEMGTLKAPTTPTFTFSAKNDCTAAANATYENQAVIFTVNPKDPLYLFYTQGTAKQYIEVSTTTNNGLKVQFPSTQG